MANQIQRPNEIDPRIGYRDQETGKLVWPKLYQTGVPFSRKHGGPPATAWMQDEFFYVIQVGRRDDLAIREDLLKIVDDYFVAIAPKQPVDKAADKGLPKNE